MYVNLSRETNEILDRSRARAEARVMKTGDPVEDRHLLEHVQNSLRRQMAEFLTRERAQIREGEFDYLARLELLVVTPEMLAEIVAREAHRLWAPAMSFEPKSVKTDD